MEKTNRLRIKFTLVSGEKEKIKTKKVFYGSLFFIFLSVLGTLAAWFFRISWQKAENRFESWQLWSLKLFPRLTPLKLLFSLAVLNLGFWGGLNRGEIVAIYKPLIKKISEISIPIALGKTEEEVVLGSENAVNIDDLKKEAVTENSLQKVLGEEKDLNLSLVEERCQENKSEKKSSELCGENPQDEELEKELKKMDYLDKLKNAKSVKKVQKINAPGPHVFEKDSLGRKVCNKSNDKPGKSDKGKGKHMDMECCLDPDEYPNPHCYYPPEKYGKYL